MKIVVLPKTDTKEKIKNDHARTLLFLSFPGIVSYSDFEERNHISLKLSLKRKHLIRAH